LGASPKAVELSEPNTVVQMFIYNLFALIYAPSTISLASNNKITYNDGLLKNVKCTLYSKSIRLAEILNSGLSAEDIIAKASVSHFLKFMEEMHNTNGDQEVILKCIEWILL
jgi:recombinational DNA repair protein (RecF pathway)